MTKENKELLLKDLCARLPYGVRGVHRDRVHYLMNVDWGFGTPCIEVDGYDAWFPIDTFKPYLRPMSSMTNAEFYYLDKSIGFNHGVEGLKLEELDWQEWFDEIPYRLIYLVFDWLNAHHFDYRGLIPAGLALEAPKDMYKTK